MYVDVTCIYKRLCDYVGPVLGSEPLIPRILKFTILAEAFILQLNMHSALIQHQHNSLSIGIQLDLHNVMKYGLSCMTTFEDLHGKFYDV